MSLRYRSRGRLARVLADKCITDDYLKHYDKNKWYHVDSDRIPTCLQSSFVQLGLDQETRTFLEISEEKSSWLLTQLWHIFVQSILKFFITQTSINGLLQRGSMFVFSREQFLALMPASDGDAVCPANSSEPSHPPPARTLLDLGAGDGAVTSVVAGLYDEVYVTEVSPTMKRILAAKGYKVLGVTSWADEGIMFDTVLCLNLLDRCDCPLDILADMKRVLPPHGLLVLALVLPFKPYVESGRADHMPSQALCVTGEMFEEQVSSVVHDVLTPAGYTVVRWSRTPYLCEGDLSQAYYWLDDVLFVLKPTATASP